MTLIPWLKSLFAKPILDGLTRMTSWRPKNRHPHTPDELENARALRAAAQARFNDAVRRADTRDQGAYVRQLERATRRELEAAVSRVLAERRSA